MTKLSIEEMLIEVWAAFRSLQGKTERLTLTNVSQCSGDLRAISLQANKKTLRF